MSIYSKENRHLPFRPDLDQLKRQAKELLRSVRSGDSAAIKELNHFHPDPPSPNEAKLSDAQLALARSYQAPSWMRLVQACDLVEAIWCNDVKAGEKIVSQNPKLIHESALVRESNWGPPLSYAANLGRNEIIELMRKF